MSVLAAFGDERIRESPLSKIFEINNLLCAPLTASGRVHGAIIAINKTRTLPETSRSITFSKSDEVSLNYLAVMTSVALNGYADYIIDSDSDEAYKLLSASLSEVIEELVRNSVNEAYTLLNADRISLFVKDEQDHTQLKCLVSSDIEGMSVPNNKGIVGKAFSEGVLLNAADASKVPFHSKVVDEVSGYRTKSILSSPLVSSDGQTIGVIQALNKNASGEFSVADEEVLSQICERTAYLLSLMTMSPPNKAFAEVIATFADVYSNLLHNGTIAQLMEEAQTIAKEFTHSDNAYVCSISAENGGSLVIASPIGETILPLQDLPSEIVTALDWGIATQIVGCSGDLEDSPNSFDYEVLPGIEGRIALVVPLLSRQEYLIKDHHESQMTEMSRLLLLTRHSETPFRRSECEAVNLFARLLAKAASYISIRGARAGYTDYIDQKISLINSVVSLQDSFVVCIDFSGQFIVANRPLNDVFGASSLSGHFSTWIDSKNEQLLRDLTLSFEDERSITREDYLLASKEGGGGTALDYSVLSMPNRSLSCLCKSCGLRKKSEPSSDGAETTPFSCISSGFIMFIARQSSQSSLSNFRALCKRPEANPAGWFDSSEDAGRLSEAWSTGRDRGSVLSWSSRSAVSPRDVDALSHRSYSNVPFEEDIRHGGSTSSSDILRLESAASVDVPYVAAIDGSTVFEPTINLAKLTLKSFTDEDLLSWDFNVLLVKEKSTLRNIIVRLFHLHIDLPSISVDPKTLSNFIHVASRLYKDVLFHNFHHATCITHATSMLMRETESIVALPKHLSFGLLLSAVVHDIEHPGNTNLFEINRGSALAILYNDQSVLENHHCATAFRIMSRPGLDVLGNMSADFRKEVRKLMISSIMSTDMSKHAELVEETVVRANHVSGWKTSEFAEQVFYAKIILHAADLSNPIRKFDIAFQWGKLIAAEFNEQTKLETALGLPVLSFMVSTCDEMIIKNELSFSTFVVAPMWRGLVRLFPNLNYLLDQLVDNAQRYSEMVAATGDGSASSRLSIKR